MPPSLTDLPTELLDSVAFDFACPALHGLPLAITPLLLTCSALNHRLSNSRALYARIFNYKFSSSAIRRRAFTPKSSEYSWQLKWYCDILRNIKLRLASSNPYQESDPEAPTLREVFFALWTMCTDDDGCNRMQLECANVYEWVQGFVRTQLYPDGPRWPEDNASNSFAMWIMWYLTTKERLLQEQEDERESLISLILPFVTVPYRYPSAYAPPNHFHLPLATSSEQQQEQFRSSHAFTIPTPHGPYPIYISPQRVWSHMHYERRTPTTIPLVTESAKLLYFSRRETLRFGIPPLPVDRQEFNNRTRERIRNEAQASGLALSPTELDARVAEEVGPTQQDIEEMNASLLGGERIDEEESHLLARFGKGGGTSLVEAAPSIKNVHGEYVEIDESSCLSRRWDNDWWRIRQCRNCWEDVDADTPGSTPLMAAYSKMGKVYEPGSLSGLWSGRMLIPSEQRLQALLLPPDLGPEQLPADGDAAPGPDVDQEQVVNDVDGQSEDQAQGQDLEPAQDDFPFPAQFSEDFVGPTATVPVYMRLTEYVCYAPNKACPAGGPNAAAPIRSSGAQSTTVTLSDRDDFDQGLSNGYFPEGTEFKPTTDGDGLRVIVPPRSSQSGETEEYVYQRYIGSKRDDSRGKAKAHEPGRAHDPETCPGCRVREELMKNLNKREESLELEENEDMEDEELDEEYEEADIPCSSSVSSSYDDEELPSQILPCNGIQDVIVVGETDGRHGAAWNHYKFHGRVRAYDGMVGVLRTPRNPRLGNIFFYGSIVGGKNFVGNWKIANLDPQMPGWEGAFSLGRKIEP